jgi:Pyruvate/2-oxoacid:ferredoxin oxidoreductase delta subunit
MSFSTPASSRDYAKFLYSCYLLCTDPNAALSNKINRASTHYTYNYRLGCGEDSLQASCSPQRATGVT